MKVINSLRKPVVVVGSLCAAVVLSLTGCDRADNSGGTADDSLNRARGHLRDAGNDLRDAATNRDSGVLSTNDQRSLDRTADETRDATRDATKDVGRGLERAGQGIQDAASTNR